jgi:hypothetical protein
MTEVITISLPLKLRKKIDSDRGLVPRSKYIAQKLEIIFSDINQKQENFDSSDSITAAKQEEESDESTAST